MIDYWLKAPASGPVTLEVLDSSGKIVRHFSSADKPADVDEKELNVPTYWIRPERTVSVQSGMHRFLWDGHLAPPESLEHDYPISAIYRDTPRYPLGPAALPGTYTVKLTVNGAAFSQPLTLRMDPRVKATDADLKAQFELENRITDAMRRDFDALTQVRALRTRLKELTSSGNSAVQPAVTDLDKKLAGIEGAEGGFGASYLTGPSGRGLVRLNDALNTLLSVADSADAAPTTQTVSMTADVEKVLGEQLAAWSEIQNKDLPALNATLKLAGVPPLSVSMPATR